MRRDLDEAFYRELRDLARETSYRDLVRLFGEILYKYPGDAL